MATPETLMRQAPMTIEVYLLEAVKIIDEQFGSGYAKKNPELVGSFIQACASDFQAGFLGGEIEKLAELIASKLEENN